MAEVLPQIDIIGYRLPSYGISRWDFAGTGTRGSAPRMYDPGVSPYEPIDYAAVPEIPVPPPPTVDTPPSTVVVVAPAPQPVPAITVGVGRTPTEADLPFVTVSAPRPKPAPKPKPRPRRSKPAPKPSRRTRPLPRRPGPRIPIEVPALVRFGLGRLAGVLALVPALFEGLKALDRDSQDKINARLFGTPGDDRERSRDPLADAARLRKPAVLDEQLPTIVVAAQRPLETVTVTGRAPARLPAPAPLPFNLVSPRLDYGFEPLPAAQNRPSPAPRPAPEPVNAPNLFPSPLASPSPAPAPMPTPRPTPGGPRPGIPASPSLPPSIVGNVVPLPAAQPVPQPALDKCNCDSKQKKKPKKKQNGRTVCYGGTYVEKSKSLSKSPKRRVDCATGKTLGA